MIIELALLIAGLIGSYHYGRYEERVLLEDSRIQCAAEVIDVSKQRKECTDMFEPAGSGDGIPEDSLPDDAEIDNADLTT